MRDDALSTREPVSEPTRFTPGPWTWEADDDSPLDRPSIIVRGSRVIDRTQSLRRDMRDMPSANQKVAYVYTPTEPVGPHGGQKCTKNTVREGQANAALIAAAPDLLAACEALLEASRNLRGEFVVKGEITGETLEPMFRADDEAQAAIAKAKGANQ